MTGETLSISSVFARCRVRCMACGDEWPDPGAAHAYLDHLPRCRHDDPTRIDVDRSAS